MALSTTQFQKSYAAIGVEKGRAPVGSECPIYFTSLFAHFQFF